MSQNEFIDLETKMDILLVQKNSSTIKCESFIVIMLFISFFLQNILNNEF